MRMRCAQTEDVGYISCNEDLRPAQRGEMMLIHLFPFVCLACAVFGELCEFPSNHPIQDLENGDTAPVEVMNINQVYEYTDWFGTNCIGCVRKINFCYQPHSSHDSLMTIELRRNGNGNGNGNGVMVRTYNVTVNSSHDTNCPVINNLDAAYRCVEQTLTQSLVVSNQNSHYALRIPNTASLLLRHLTETANGNQETLDGSPLAGNVYKPLFYFTIDTSDSSCSNVPTVPTSSSCMELPTTPPEPSSEALSSSGITSSTIIVTSTRVSANIPSSSSSIIELSTTTDSPPQSQFSSIKLLMTTTYQPPIDSTEITSISSSGVISNTPTTTSTEHHPTTTTIISSNSETATKTPPSSTTHSSDQPEVATGAQSGGDDSPTAAIGGVIGALLVIIILLVIVVIVVVILMKRRQRKVIVKHGVGEDSEGFNNIVYGAAGTDKIDISLSSVVQKSNTYKGKTDTDNVQHYECIENPSSATYEAAPYTEPDSNGQVLDTSYAAVGAEIYVGKRPSLHYEVEDIYEAPASNETGLYVQYEKIKIAAIPRNSIRTTECLGSGQFGTVNRGVWQNPTSTLDVAIKTLKSSAKEEDKVKFLQEGAIMGQFKHPNVVRLHGIVREQEAVLLVIELLAKEDLREHLLTLRPEEGGSVDENLKHMLLSYCRQVISGLAYLAKKGFVHRDIAARNILLSEDHETCKIADFGMSRDLADETYYISTRGKIPVKWTAPEALHYKKYSTASDVWSFGCLMYEIWSLGHKPFEANTNAQAIKMVDGGYRLPPPPGCPRAIYQLMIDCWNPTASERPSADTASQTLSKSDPILLKWEVADKPAGVPQALRLGAPLNSTTLLYPELQTAYLPTSNDYEDTD